MGEGSYMKTLRKFNIEDYGDNCVMHCSSKEQAIVFTQYLHRVGLRWSSGRGYDSKLGWSAAGGGSCYRFRSGTTGSLAVYTSLEMRNSLGTDGTDIVVLEFDDFDWLQSKPLNYDEVMCFQQPQ